MHCNYKCIMMVVLAIQNHEINSWNVFVRMLLQNETTLITLSSRF